MKSISRGRYLRMLVLMSLLVLTGGTLRILTVPGSFGVYICNQRPMTEAQVAAFRGLDIPTLVLLKTQRGLTIPELCIIPQAKLDRAVNRAHNPNPDHPGEAVTFRKLQLQDETGQVPFDGLVKAEEQIKAMRAAQNLNSDVSASAAGISSGSWQWLGPGNIGGRVRSIVINPSNTDILWAASVSGGIWKSTDAGVSWQILDDFMANMAVSTLLIDPTNPDILYAGTGEGFYNGDGLQGNGVFKTINGGITWNQLSATDTSDWLIVNRLAISPDGTILLAATRSGIWRSTNAGVSWSQSSVNATLDINFNPVDGSKAIASGYGFALYSTDAGQSWTASELPSATDRVEIAYARSNPAVVFASADINSGEIWKSINGGVSYARVNTGNNYLGGQGWYDNIIWVDPTNVNNLVVGGIDLWRSTNGGTTLTKISQWWSAPLSAHADNHYIIEDPGFNGSTNVRVYFGNDGGVYQTDDIYTVSETSGWTELNNNLGITQFYGAAGNPSNGNIIGGTQDNGTLFYTPSSGTEGWTTPFGGDGGWSAADPLNANYYYGEYVNLNLHRSNDGGVSSDYIFGGYWFYNSVSGWEWKIKNAPYRIDDAVNGHANFIAPFILDPNNPSRLLAGGLSLWRSNDVKAANTDTTGPAWASIKNSIGDYISAIAVAPGNSNIIWVGHNNGNVYKTINGTAASPTWTLVDTAGVTLPNRYVTRITIDKNDNNRVYVTFGGFSADNVWLTTNAGTAWSSISSGLPNLPVRSLAINPGNSNWIYIGTELGVFVSENAGASWVLPQDGPTNTSVDELFWMNSTLVAATHGRGLFKTETLSCVSLTTSANPVAGGSVVIVPDQNCPTGTGYVAYTQATLRANPNPGYVFTGWTGSVVSSVEPLVLPLNASKSITANFELAKTISGNAGVSGVTLSYVVGAGKTVTSDAHGNYSISVPSGWSGTVTPIKTGISFFTPASRSYANVSSNLTAQTYKANKIILSIGAQDGYILESSETSGIGSTVNKTSNLWVGDEAKKKQVRSIVTFATGAGLPDTAVITKVTLKLQKQAVVGGGNPVSMFQGFFLDVKTGPFGTAGLVSTDFQAVPNKTFGPYLTVLAGNWYSIDLTPAKSYINKAASLSGLTEIRVRFKLDDNNNTVANYLSLYSGDAASNLRPQLIIEYSVP